MKRSSLDRAVEGLVATQHHDGGWGYHAGVPTDADSTACVLLAIAALRRRDAIAEQAAVCLSRHQDPESGGVPTYLKPGPIRRFMRVSGNMRLRGWCSPHLEVTAAAGRAFAAVGKGFRSHAAAAWSYVRARQRKNGCWHSYWWAAPHYPTLQAAELARAVGDRNALRRAAIWALHEQRDDGGWGTPTSAFETALSLALLVCAGERGPATRRAVERLTALQNVDGGWPSHAEMRIPPPDVWEPDEYGAWRVDRLGTGVVIRDVHRIFTTAACVAALARSEAP